MESLSLLIVDDDPLSRRLLTKVLEGAGVKSLLSAENGVQGVESLKASDTDIHAVICDIDMPEMNGWEFVRKVRMGTVERFKDIPIYMLTARGSEENEQKASFHKISGYILKPPRKEVIAEIIAEIKASVGER